jgi:predicted enzyme related to lactoylglutathione lyase
MTPTGHPAPAWFDISSPDAPRARHFYQEMFGWPVNLLDETYALVSGEGGQPAGGIAPAETPMSRIAAFADPDGNLIGLLSR